VPWLYGDDDSDRKNDDDVIVDLSDLIGDDSVIDAGVTSGSDPTSWDPIEVGKND
jgi:hypothetical protein